ncbi:hypothetical protein HL653_06260 [Sphingomonas sp. AP4-R1]|uniref:hypothetical protein n=1 Tax=Sphingomonas sp. AP4-R1 TaxID=2735134 RepID=UPI001493CE55|nr:hypothetical protein [Sphingomonas sp. AP4-R1]QJU57447.1 hypothetical protein HL653_06260 [Sphingomonas sp. AP4-R1]
MLPRFLPAGVLPIIAAISGDAQLSANSPFGGGGAETEAGAFVPIADLDVPIFGNSRIEGRINARLVLQMSSPMTAGLIARRMPDVRMRIVETMLDYGSLHVSGFAPVDAEALSKTLNARVKARDKTVRRVLIVALSASPV